MTGFWDRLRGKAGGADGPCDDSAAALRALFASYPANPPRHPGPPVALDESQRDANLAQFLATRDRRLAIVADFLRGHGVDTAPLRASPLDCGAAVAAARAVDGWLDAALPRRAFSPVAGDEAPNPPTQAFRADERGGDDRYDGFLADLGLLEGEAIRRADPRFDWAINRLPEFADRGSYGRICLIKPGSPGWAPTVFEMDAHMLAICHPKMAPRGNNSGRWFGELLNGACERGYDPR